MAQKKSGGAAPATPKKDERKRFFLAGYRLRNADKKIEFTRIGLATELSEITKEEALKRAQEYLSKLSRHTHYYPIDGIMIFESVAVVRLKQVKVEMIALS